MKPARVLASTLALIGLLLIGGVVLSRAQQAPAQAPRQPLVNAQKLIMQPEEAAEGGPVLGNASQPGFYITRNRFLPGRGSRPHYHDMDRYVTVIKGTWWTASGDVYQPDKMTPIKAGGFMFHPAGFHHYDMARDEEVIVQIMGMGPVKTVQTEVDASGKPVTPQGRGGAGRGGE